MVAISAISTVGLIMAGWASNNKYALFGAMRSAAQIVSYEIPSLLIILIPVMIVGSLSLQDLTQAQAGGLQHWFLFRYFPIMPVAFVCFFVAALAETNRAPFDIPEAESELVAALIFTILVPGTFTILVPYLLLSSEAMRLSVHLGGLRYGGALLIILGAYVYVRCAWDFAFAGLGTPAPIAAPEKLVTRGLFCSVRNPIYLGVMVLLTGEAWLFESMTLIIYAFCLWMVFHLFVVFHEEPILRHRFGESYEYYCQTVPRWIPRF